MSKPENIFILRFLRSFCPEHLYEEIEGDLIQKFNKDARLFDEGKAKRRLVRNTLHFFRPGILLRNRFSMKLNQIDMFNHFLKIFIRNSWKRGSYSFITLTGLVLGMTAFVLIGAYVLNERSYDQFHTKKDQLFRVRQDRYTRGVLTRQWTAGPWGIGVELKRDFPEVVRYVNVNRGGTKYNVLSNGAIFFREERVFYASEDFFKLFSYPLVKGIDSEVLRRPFTMVISESMAKKYFKDIDPIGKTLKNNGKEEYEITGVFKDVPENTHMKFDALFSFESLLKIVGPTEAQDLMSSWAWSGNYTYIELTPGADAKAFEAKLPAYVDKEAGEILRSWNEGMAFVLQPITSIHLYSDFKDEMEVNGDGRSVQFLMIIAIFILLMAWINYVNLATARSLERAKEVGIRKVLGSARLQLIRQFLLESFFIKLIALSLTIVIVLLVLPSFSDFVNRRVEWSTFLSREIIINSVIIFFFGVIASGLYPAFALSGFKPVSVLKGKFQSSFHGVFLRKGLVTFQFATSVVLLIMTFTVFRQIQFMRNSKLGVDTEQILVMNGPQVKPSAFDTRLESFRQSLVSQSGIESITVSSDVPGQTVTASNGNIRIDGEDIKQGNSFRIVMSDEDFLKTFKIELLTGRTFSRDFNDNWKSAMVNETAMNVLGFTDPEKIINKGINVFGNNLRIIGVLKDYHQESLKKKVDQLIFVCAHDESQLFSVKIKGNQNLNEEVAFVKEKYEAAFPGNPFYYFFLDEHINHQYKSDWQFGRVFGLFTIMAIIIACLGLFGLSSYIVVQRTKEIGIRKILGASVKQITILVSRDFLLMVLLAVIVSWPLSYFIAQNWLNGFAYRIDLGMILFIAPAMGVMVIAIFTVAGQSIGAATANPVNSLRSE